jgi:hypothetical protein
MSRLALCFSFLLNKQLFSSLKIRRYMMRWTKCWARKSPAYVKNLGNIRVENSPILAGKESAEYLCAGLTRYLTSIASRAVPPTHPLRNAILKDMKCGLCLVINDLVFQFVTPYFDSAWSKVGPVEIYELGGKGFLSNK